MSWRLRTLLVPAALALAGCAESSSEDSVQTVAAGEPQLSVDGDAIDAPDDPADPSTPGAPDAPASPAPDAPSVSAGPVAAEPDSAPSGAAPVTNGSEGAGDGASGPASDPGAGGPGSVTVPEVVVPVPQPSVPEAVPPDEDSDTAEDLADAGGSFGDAGTVVEPAPGEPATDAPLGFQIDLVFREGDAPDDVVLAAFLAAKERWEGVITGDLPDVSVGAKTSCNGNDVPAWVDDLVIFITAAPIDGPEGILGAASPCALRSVAPRLPFAGAMEFDEEDLLRFAQSGRLEEVVLHEMGHVLGIGSMWEGLGLLQEPSDGSGLHDTAFVGTAARAAFDEVGGNAYVGNKVPVEAEGTAGEINGHWREAALGSELMTTRMGASHASLSAVTIGSLADLGYQVTYETADPYTWPSEDDPFMFRAVGAPSAGDVIDLSHDHLPTPLYEVDPDGTVRLLRE